MAHSRSSHSSREPIESSTFQLIAALAKRPYLGASAKYSEIFASSLARIKGPDKCAEKINDRLNCATAAEAPLGEAQERHHFDHPTAHTSGAYQHSEAA
jgi:hypothetical protein